MGGAGEAVEETARQVLGGSHAVLWRYVLCAKRFLSKPECHQVGEISYPEEPTVILLLSVCLSLLKIYIF